MAKRRTKPKPKKSNKSKVKRIKRKKTKAQMMGTVFILILGAMIFIMRKGGIIGATPCLIDNLKLCRMNCSVAVVSLKEGKCWKQVRSSAIT